MLAALLLASLEAKLHGPPPPPSRPVEAAAARPQPAASWRSHLRRIWQRLAEALCGRKRHPFGQGA